MDLIKKKNSDKDEQIDFYKKQIDSLQSIKKELNSQILILNEELDKTKNLNLKCLNLEKENRKLLEENSEIKNEQQNLQFKQSNAANETNELRHKLK